MTDFVIEKGIPLPGPRKGGRPKTYRWEELGPPVKGKDGLMYYESVVVPTYDTAKMGQAWALRRGLVFTYQKQPDGSGWRVWRTE